VSNKALIPAIVVPVIDEEIAVCSDSPETSTRLAFSRRAIPEPPQSFGTIQVQRLLAAQKAAARAGNAPHETHDPARRHAAVLRREDDLDDDESEGTTAVDMFSIGGGAGIIGRWLQRFLSAARRGEAAGSPGIDAVTHSASAAYRRKSRSVMSTATAEPEAESEGDRRSGVKYPEWDVHARGYRRDWCTVQEMEPPQKTVSQPNVPDATGLRRPLSRIAKGLDRCQRQMHGDEVDIDAAINAHIELVAGSTPDEAIYVDSLPRRRDLSVLILLDISGSVATAGAEGRTVHELQRAAAAALAGALHGLGDRVALYAFNSQGRSMVQLVPVMRFGAPFGPASMRRLHSLEPGAYSRLGAAIRHGAAVLEDQGGTSRRLLVVLSDGLAYDHGYERHYGAADARRALSEARRRGTGSLCLTIGAGTEIESLRYIFGSAAYAAVSRPSQLDRVIGPLFRSALRSAEVRRRVSSKRIAAQA
jgi:nitric oxide reductase activation protein